MKKFFLLFLVLLSFAWTKAEAQNIFASELSAGTVASDGTVTFTYTLNAAASEVVINISNGDEFTINSAPGLAKGINTVTRQLSGGTLADNYTWSVKASSSTVYSTPTQVSLDTQAELQYFMIRGGVAVDNNPESPFFGRIYIGNTGGGTSTTSGRNTTWGIFVLNAALQDITTQGSAGWQGGMTNNTTGTNGAYSPFHISVAPNGDVYVADCTPTNSGLRIMNPARPQDNFISAFTTSGITRNSTSGLVSVGTTNLHLGVVQTRWVGNDLYAINFNLTASNFATTFDRYANFSVPRSTGYTTVGPNAGTAGMGLTTSIANFCSDGKGGFWIAQYRGTENSTNADLIHVSATGTTDFKSYAYTQAGSPQVGPLMRGAVAYNAETNKLVVAASGQLRIYTPNWDGNTFLSMPSTRETITGTGTNVDGLEFDVANNLYVVGSSNERLRVYAFPKSVNTHTTPAPSSNPVAVTTAIPLPGGKTFNVTVPNGTEKVYVIGDFTNSWSQSDAIQLTRVGTTNEFTIQIDCQDGETYKYLCEKEVGSDFWAYQEGAIDTNTGIAGQGGNRTVVSQNDVVTDVVSSWYCVKKITFNVSFASGVTVPNQLKVLVVGPAGESWTPIDVTLTKSGNTFTGFHGGNTGDIFPNNTEYKYYAMLGNEIWEAGNNRWAIYPSMTDEISGFENAFSISGTYYIPAGQGQQGWNNLTTASADINQFGISGNVKLLITDNITQANNVGLVNNSSYSIMIKPDGETRRTITFTQNTANAIVPAGTGGANGGALIIGSKSGSTYADIAPAKNITIENLGLIANGLATTCPLMLVDACDNIVIKNCLIRNNLTAGIHVIQLYMPNGRSEANVTKIMPKNVIFEGNTIESSTTSTNTAYIFHFAFDVTSPTPSESVYASGIEINNNIITNARQRAIYLSFVDGLKFTGNEISSLTAGTGILSAVIQNLNSTKGDFYITKNKFKGMAVTNSNSGYYGGRIILMSGGKWYIENNYFSGFSKTGSELATLEIIRTNSNDAFIRHNTFYMKALQGTQNYAQNPAAGTNVYCAINIASGTPVIENNLFVLESDAYYNYAIRGTAPDASANNVYCLPADATKAAVNTGSIPEDLKMVDAVEFADATAGNLDLIGASIGDENLSVPILAAVPEDIYGTVRLSPTYAGAFQSEMFTGIKTTTVNGIKVICLGNQITVISDSAIQSVKLFDLQGRTIESKQNVSSNVYPLTVPAAGIYIVEVLTQTGRSVHKVAAN